MINIVKVNVDEHWTQASKLLKDLGLAIINNSVSRQNFPVDTGNLRQSVFIKNA